MNKNGFTLLELLATIIILGLLTTIVVGAILPLLNRGNNEYYKSQENMIVLAARDYFADYRSRLPKEIGETSKVTLKELIEGKYIDPIKDRNDNDCDYENSTVVVQKITEKDYQYYVTLICDNDNNYQSETDDKKPNIVFNPNEKVTTGTIEVKMVITDNKGIASYRYVIEKDGSVIDDSNYQNYTTDPIISLTEKGTYKITGYAIDTGGNIREKESGTYEIYEGISCDSVEFTSNVEPNTWTKDTITVNIKVPSNTYKYEIFLKKDNSEYKLENTVLGSLNSEINLTSTGNYQIKVILYDSSSNSCTKESQSYNIDKVAPSCGTITGASTSWTNKDRNITVGCNDSNSGCTSSSFSNTFTTSGKTGIISIKDHVGNTNECAVDVYVDKDPPYAQASIFTNYVSATWCPDRPTEPFPKVVVMFVYDDLSGMNSVTFSWPLGSNWTGSLNRRQTYTANIADVAGANVGSASMCGWSGTYNWSACDRVGNCGSGGV